MQIYSVKSFRNFMLNGVYCGGLRKLAGQEAIQQNNMSLSSFSWFSKLFTIILITIYKKI